MTIGVRGPFSRQMLADVKEAKPSLFVIDVPWSDVALQTITPHFSLRPDYDDAMAYLNLLYRRKADMVEKPDERAALLKQADDLVDKVKEIKQKRADQPQSLS